jgi:hypothetical protein
MHNSRLVTLLRSLSRSEMLGLKKFVSTPFFNQRREVPALLDTLDQSLRTGKPLPDKATLYRALFGEGAPSDQRVRMAMTFLYQLTGQYLAVQDFLADPADWQLRLAGVLRRRQLPVHAAQAQAEAARQHRQSTLQNADFQQQQYEILLEQYRADASSAQPGNHLQALSTQLDTAFLSRKLWQACFLHSHHTRTPEPLDQGLLPAALEHLHQHPALLTEPAVGIYYWCYRMLTEPTDDAHFQQFKHLVQAGDGGPQFPPEELRDLYILAINFCIRQYNAGNSGYLREQFDFYRVGLERGYFLVEGFLSHLSYLNAATVAMVLGEMAWAEAFIADYAHLLLPAYRERLPSFNQARLEYRRRRLDAALLLLQKADYRDPLLHLAAKTLQLKIFYELGEYDLLTAHLQTMQAFVGRKKTSLGYHRDNYLALLRFTRKLLETNLFDKNLRAALRSSIEQTKAVAEKEWLLEQVG